MKRIFPNMVSFQRQMFEWLSFENGAMDFNSIFGFLFFDRYSVFLERRVNFYEVRKFLIQLRVCLGEFER